jgi:type IV pilus assembly protein PilB
MEIDIAQFKKVLTDSGLVSQSDIEAAEKLSKEKKQNLGDILVSNGKLKDSDRRRLEAFALGIPFVSLLEKKIDFEVLSLIPEPIARTNNVVAYNKTGEGLEVAMLDVADLPTIDFVKKKTGLKILPRLSDGASIKLALQQYKKSLQADFDEIIKKESITFKTFGDVDKGDVSEKDLRQLSEDLPIVKIVDTLISHAILQNASDVHIEPQEEKLVVRYRIDGILHDAMSLPRDTAPGITARIKVLSGLKLDEKRLPQDGRFKLTNDTGKFSFRVSTLPTYFGEKTVIRVLRETSHGYTLEGLGFHGDALEAIHGAMRQKTGMILAAGPTGSGKTTTLYTMLDILNTADVNISTVEDPIEYQMARINQTQVKPEIGLTFANGLRTLLRQDPDIIMVGEIRDGETASLAVNASLTGHLVLSTIHTNSASGAIPRMMDMGVEPFLIVSTVKTVIAQRLVRKLTKKKEQYFLSKEELAEISKLVDLERVFGFLVKENIIKDTATWDKIPFCRAVKSEESEDGYAGRVGIHEVLVVTSSIKQLILSHAPQDEIEKQAKKEGMMTMIEDGIFLAVQGVTTTEEVLRVVSE